jgi:SAM-dependent methyltransferase
MSESLYHRRFYEELYPSCHRSASVIVPWIVRILNPKSVVDVGCGTGAWLAEFAGAGVRDVVGIDGPWVPDDMLKIDAAQIIQHDLTAELELSRRFDLVVCLEVAEHLPETGGDALIKTLTGLGATILFSAAVPGQGGTGHLNEQPPEYWDHRFALRGFQPIRGIGQRFANDPNVAWWYARNMVLYTQNDTVGPGELRKIALENPSKAVRLEAITPVILTCARNIPLVERFVDSFVAHVGQALAGPVVVVDLTASCRLPGDYWPLIGRVSPSAVYMHTRPYGMSDKESINDAAFFSLACGMQEMGGREYLLFMEDDILFSSRLITYLTGLHLESDAGFHTLYLPGGEYGSAVIEPYRFYGTQCLLFPKHSVQLILDNREEMERRFSPNYDLRWAQYLGARGFKLYAAPQSYVQHMGAVSRMGSGSHSSCNFVP